MTSLSRPIGYYEANDSKTRLRTQIHAQSLLVSHSNADYASCIPR